MRAVTAAHGKNLDAVTRELARDLLDRGQVRRDANASFRTDDLLEPAHAIFHAPAVVAGVGIHDDADAAQTAVPAIAPTGADAATLDPSLRWSATS